MGVQMRKVLKVDTSKAMEVCNSLRKDLSEENFEWVMQRTIRDAGQRAVKKIVKQEVMKEYQVQSGWVGKKIKGPSFSGSGRACICVVPIKGERGTLGGIFPAGGGGLSAGRATKNRMKKRLKWGGAKIYAKVLKGEKSVLPDELKNQGKNPPFRLPNGAVMTRKTNKPYPFVRVVGRAVPQMTDKYFEKRIEGPINDYIVKRFGQLVKEKMKI